MSRPSSSPLTSAYGGALAALNERSREIFRRIVESYLTTGEPVGSRNLSRVLPMTLSPASVRNVMSDLENARPDLRAAHQRRAAADRARPAVLLDALLEVGDVAAEERARIEAQMRAAAARHTFDTALAEASALLSGLSRGAGVVATPKANARLKHVEFVRLDPVRALVVLVPRTARSRTGSSTSRPACRARR